jgi:hypothetical protein
MWVETKNFSKPAVVERPKMFSIIAWKAMRDSASWPDALEA